MARQGVIRAFVAVIAAQIVTGAIVQTTQSTPCDRDCEISLTRLATLTDRGKEGVLPAQGFFVVRDSGGRYLLQSADDKSLLVFGAGGVIQRVIREGGDSQPFGMITNVIPSPTGLTFIYDTQRRTLVGLDKNFNAIAPVSLRYRPSFMISERQFLYAGQIATPERVGQPLHVLDVDGSILRSFGAESEKYRADEPFRYDRVVAPSSVGFVWSAPIGDYLLERWDTRTGTRSATIRVSSDWFSPSAKPPKPGQRPSPVIVALWESEGLLWVLFQDADAHWESSVAPRKDSATDEVTRDKTYDSVLEAVSIKTGKVIASKRFDHLLWGRSPAFLLTQVRPQAGKGAVQLDVWKPILKQRGVK